MNFRDHLASAARAFATPKLAGDFIPGTSGLLPAWVIANLHPLPPREMAVYAPGPDFETMLDPRRADAGELELDETTLVFSL